MISGLLRRLVPQDAISLANILALWLAALGVCVSVTAIYRSSRHPEIEITFTRPVAGLNLVAVLSQVSPTGRVLILEHLRADSQMSQFVQIIQDEQQATVVYFDDDITRSDSGFHFGKREKQSVKEKLDWVKMRLAASHKGFFHGLVQNRGSPWFAFSGAAVDPTPEIKLMIAEQKIDNLAWGDCGPLFDTAQNYFGIEGLPDNRLTNHSKKFIEGTMLEGLSAEDELASRQAILANKHIVKGITLINQEAFPVEGAMLTLEPYPVRATVAGPMAQGMSRGESPTPHAQSWQLATLYPITSGREVNRYILYSRCDGINTRLLSVEAPPFQSAAQLVTGWLSPIMASITTLLAVAGWFVSWRKERKCIEK